MTNKNIKESGKTVKECCPECNKEFLRYKTTPKICCSKECSWLYKYKQKHPNADANIKICYNCKEEKTLDEFPPLTSSIDGRRGMCRKCWYIKNPYKGQSPEKSAKDRNARLKNKYNIDQKEYERMYNLQEGKCYICKEDSISILNVDHCHISGKVRKLLCPYCNKGLGHFKDNLHNMKAAVKYLEEHQ